MTWFVYVLLATIIYGTINVLYKLGTRRNYSGLKLLHFQALSVSLISLAFLIFTGNLTVEIGALKYLFLFAALNSFFFAAGTVLKITALRYIPVNIAMPLDKLNTAFVILIGVVFLGERPTGQQYLGMLLAFFTVMLLSTAGKEKSDKRKELKTKGIIIIITAALVVSFSITVGKLASTRVPKINYIFLSYSFVFVYTYLTKRYLISPAPVYEDIKPGIIGLGVVIGLLNFSGYYMILKAWELGPLSLVQGIFSLAMIVSIILARIFYKEKFTHKIILAIITSFISVLLIKG
ncbi:MAG: EamA family transporter [Elusimicrobiota bacterium]